MVSIEVEAEWAPELVWMFEDEKISSVWDLNSGPPARSVVTISTVLPWLPAVIFLLSKY